MIHQQTKRKVQGRVESERQKDLALVQNHQQHQEEEVVLAKKNERRAENNQGTLD